MTTHQIIGFTGYAQSGKDTAAKGLIARHGFTRLAFADRLRSVAYATDPYVRLDDGSFRRLACLVDDVGWEQAKIGNEDVRRLLQKLGTEGGRIHLGENVWVDAVMREALAHDGPVVLTDVRFDNEVVAVKAHGGIVVRVDRPGVEPVNGHVSDAGIASLDVDLVIDNDSTIEALHEKVSQLVRRDVHAA